MPSLPGGNTPANQALNLIATLSDPNKLKEMTDHLKKLDAATAAHNTAMAQATKAKEELIAKEKELAQREEALAAGQVALADAVGKHEGDKTAFSSTTAAVRAQMDSDRAAHAKAHEQLEARLAAMDKAEHDLMLRENAVRDKEGQLLIKQAAMDRREQAAHNFLAGVS